MSAPSFVELENAKAWALDDVAQASRRDKAWWKEKLALS